LQALVRQLNLWTAHLPDVIPFYAVKCNNDPTLMRWMHEHKPTLGFDCASLREIEEARAICDPGRILYAQPCKKRSDIAAAQAHGVQSTVVDSVEEIEKLGEAKWGGEVLVRLLVRDGGSKQPFGKKFGAPLEWLPRMYDVARVHKLNMTGFSFHVGSECEVPRQYYDAISDCSKGREFAQRYGFHTSVVDIGGGFLPDAAAFARIAEQICAARHAYFGGAAAGDVRWIAEPGRFLAAPTHTLYTTVIGKKPVYPAPPAESDAPRHRITIDESVYGSFSNIPFDGQRPRLERMRPRAAHDAPPRPTIVFGRTCDSGDLIGADMPLLEVEEGDVLRAENMGAYTTVTASEFNGFPKPDKIYDRSILA
jgi:ornithine decarboxylase